MTTTYNPNCINNHFKSFEDYQNQYNASIENPNKFWDSIAHRLNWQTPWTKTCEGTFDNMKWFLNGTLNVSENCIDRHITEGRGNETAIIWEGNNPNESKSITYNQLLRDVSQCANALKSHGITKGDRVCIYMQMIPELAIAMLACARIGAIHSIVFGAFSADALATRIQDASCKMLITQDSGVRGTKTNIPMKINADSAIAQCPSIEKVFVVKRTGEPISWNDTKDIWWHDALSLASGECPPVAMDSEDPLFILYTSGSTGTPKGVLHTTGGYLTYASYTHEIVFNYSKGDVYWCTADIGWITGHSYIIYGPLSNGATTLMFEGVPNYPTHGRFWEICEKHNVNQFYTAPTALRALMKEGNDWVTCHDRSSIKILGTVGEPIKSPEWHWYYNVVGNKKCPIVDTWWQTETGGIMLSPLPGITPLKPGSATYPLPGITPVILNDEGEELTHPHAQGYFCIKQPWPSLLRTVYGDHDRFKSTYLTRFPGYYMTGDGVHRDNDGNYWITGRIDDVINVSGHRIGSAEVEGAIGHHPLVAEAAVVGFPHEIKGDGIYAYVTLMRDAHVSPGLKDEIRTIVSNKIGPHAKPDKIQLVPGLPKTRSGKIMRRILRQIATNSGIHVGHNDLGDTSTLADPQIVQTLIDGRA